MTEKVRSYTVHSRVLVVVWAKSSVRITTLVTINDDQAVAVE